MPSSRSLPEPPARSDHTEQSGNTGPMPDLHYLSAHETLDLFRSRQLSPVEHLEALIDRVEAHDSTINAVVDRRYDEARAEAREAAERYVGKGDAPRPLEGLCVAAKEEQPMAGRPWQQGSLAFADEVAKYDHPIIERIQSAGGIIHIRTATPEFSCAGFCHSELWGVTRNPWNTEFTPGGSSGGSGAALAAGFAPLATGSDIGGSIRIPASFSGVVGFKPPFGRVPGLAPYHLDQYCHDGPLARTVADCGLLENVIAGPHWRDVVSLRDPPQIPRESTGVEGMRVALCDARRLAGAPRRRGQHQPGRRRPERSRRSRRRGRSAVDDGAVLERGAGPLRGDLRKWHRRDPRRVRRCVERLHEGIRVIDGFAADVLRGSRRRDRAVGSARSALREHRRVAVPDDRDHGSGSRQVVRR